MNILIITMAKRSSVLILYSCILCGTVIGDPGSNSSKKLDETNKVSTKEDKHDISESKRIISFFNDLNNQLPNLLQKLEKEIEFEDTNYGAKSSQYENDDKEEDYLGEKFTENGSISKVLTKNANTYEEDYEEYFEENPTTSAEDNIKHIKVGKNFKKIPVKNHLKKINHVKTKGSTKVLNKKHSKLVKSGSHSSKNVSSEKQLKKNSKFKTTKKNFKKDEYEDMNLVNKQKSKKSHKYHTKLKRSKSGKREIKTNEGEIVEKSRNYIKFDK